MMPARRMVRRNEKAGTMVTTRGRRNPHGGVNKNHGKKEMDMIHNRIQLHLQEDKPRNRLATLSEGPLAIWTTVTMETTALMPKIDPGLPMAAPTELNTDPILLFNMTLKSEREISATGPRQAV